MSPAAVSQGPAARRGGLLAWRRCTTKPVRLPAPCVRHCSRTSVRAREYRSLLMVTLGGGGYPAGDTAGGLAQLAPQAVLTASQGLRGWKGPLETVESNLPHSLL